MLKNSAPYRLGHKYLPWVLLALLCLPVVLARRASMSPDEADYLVSGWNIARGLGPVDMFGSLVSVHPPLFPIMVAMVFKVVQPSAQNAVIVSQLATCMSTVLVYLLGCQLSGRKVGLAGALVVGISGISYWATRSLLGATQTAFMLLSLVVLIWAFKRQEGDTSTSHAAPAHQAGTAGSDLLTLGLFAVSGVALGLGFLVKETAVLWVPLPLVTALLLNRGWRGIVGSLVHLAGFGLTVVWWWIYFFARTGQVFLFQGGSNFGFMTLPLAAVALVGIVFLIILAGPRRRASLQRLAVRLWPGPVSALMPALGLATLLISCILLSMALARLGAPIRGVADVLGRIGAMPNYMRGVISPYALLGWLLVAFHALGRQRRNLYPVLIGLLLYLPLFFRAAAPTTAWLPTRNFMTIQWLSYLVLGYLIVFAARWADKLLATVSHRFRWRLRPSSLATVTAFIVLLGFSIDSGVAFFNAYHTKDYLNSRGELNYSTLNMGQWLNEHVSPGSRIMVTHSFADAVFLHTEGRHSMYYWPDGIAGLGVTDGQLRLVSGRHAEGMANLVYVHHNSLWGGKGEEYWAISADDLLAGIADNQVDYFVTATWDVKFRLDLPGLPSFFVDHPAFEMVYSRGPWRGISLYIFKIHADALPVGSSTDSPVAVYQGTVQYWLDRTGHTEGKETQALEASKTAAPFSMSQILEALDNKPILILPDNAEAIPLYEQLAQVFLPLDVNLAAFEYQQALTRDSELADSYLSIAQELAQEHGDACGPWALLGDVYGALGRHQEAENAYLTAIQASQWRPEVLAAAHRGLGQLYLDSKRYQQSIEHFEQALLTSTFGAQSARTSLLLAQGHLYRAQGQIDQAALAYQQALAANPDPLVGARIAEALLAEEGEWRELATSEALDWLDTMMPRDANDYVNLGRLYAGQGRIEEAFSMYHVALPLEPDRQTKADIYALLGQLYDAQGDPEAAILHFQRAVEADPSSVDRHSRLAPDVVRQTQVLTRLAEHYAQQGNLESAMGQLDEALELLPGDEAIAARLDQLRHQYAIEHPLTSEAGEFSLKPQGWVHIYLLQLLLLSLALGSWTLHLARWLRVPRLSRFLIGCCATPFVMGAWMLLMAAIVPGGRRLLFLAPPLAVAVALLVFYGPRTLRRLIRDHRRTLRASRNPWPVYLVYVGAVVVLIVLVPKLVQNGRPPTLAHDASIYLSQALPFAQERSLGATSGWLGAPSDANEGSNHNFVYPAFLSYALLNTGHNSLGYPYDHAARAGFQATFIFMLLSVVALAGTTRFLGAGALAVILLMQVPQFEYISIASSRDAFRIIPLMLLAAALAGLSPPRLRHRLRPVSLLRLLLPLMVLAAFSLSGHTLGGLVVVTTALAWLIWGLLGKARWLNMTLVLVAMGVGLLLGGFHYLDRYLETGSSGATFTRQTMQRRVLERPESILAHERVAVSMTTPQRLSTLLKRDQYRLSIAGLVGAVLAIAGWAGFKRSRRTQAIPFIGLMVLTGSLPFLGVFDIGYYFSAGFIANQRYPLHWYAFAAVCAAAVVMWGYSVFMQRYSERVSAWFNKQIVILGGQLRRGFRCARQGFRRAKRGFVRLISGQGVAAWTVLRYRLRTRRREPATTTHASSPLSGIWHGTSTKEAISPGEISPAVKGARRVGAGAVIAGLALVLVTYLATSSAYSIVSSTDWRTVDAEETVASLHQRVDPLLKVVRALPSGQRLLLEDARYNYYLRNQAIAVGTLSIRNVLGAESENEVQVALKELNVNAVALDQESISSGRWYQSFLFNFLNDLDSAVLIMSDRQFLVYKIVEDDAARTRLIEASVEKLDDYAPASYLVDLIKAGYLDFHYDIFSLPFNWQGSDTIGLEDLTQTAPPLMDTGHRGDFTFSRAPGEDGIVIRVSSVSAAEGNARQIQFGVSFQDQGSGLEFYEYSPEDKQDEIEIGDGHIVILSLWARITSPSEVDSVFIQDKTDNWERSKTPIMSSAWQQYVVARVIRDEATDVTIGVYWEPETGDEWLEIRDMRVMVARPAAVEWLKQGWTHYEQREYEQAIAAFEQAVALDEATNTEGWAGKGLSHLALGQHSEGVGILAPVVGAPADLTPVQLALVYTALESAYCQGGLTAECRWIHQHIDAYLRAAKSSMLPSFVMQLMNVGYVDSHYPSYSLPFNWQGPDTVGLKDLTQTAPPLMDTGHRGGFTFSRTSAEDGDVIRVSSVSAAEGNLRQIQFGVSFQDQGSGLEFYEYSPEDKQDEIEIGDGHIVILSLWARISSPSEVDSVFIQDKTDNWERSKTPIMSTAWQQYVVARVIRDEATDVTIGVYWEPKTGDEWLEIRDMRVLVSPPQSASQP